MLNERLKALCVCTCMYIMSDELNKAANYCNLGKPTQDNHVTIMICSLLFIKINDVLLISY